MDVYLHDSSAALRFVLRGELAGGDAQDLEYAWTTATSVLGSKELVVDISGVTDAMPAAGNCCPAGGNRARG
jgi:hypothetical protein